MLTDTELASMRTEAERSLAGTAIIQTRAWQSDGGGGGTHAWTSSGTVDCRLMPQTAPENAEPMTGARLSPDADWVATLPADTAISTDSRIVTHGKTLEVSSVPDRTWEITKRVLCNEVT